MRQLVLKLYLEWSMDDHSKESKFFAIYEFQLLVTRIIVLGQPSYIEPRVGPIPYILKMLYCLIKKSLTMNTGNQNYSSLSSWGLGSLKHS
jgi:hypothetical protein